MRRPTSQSDPVAGIPKFARGLPQVELAAADERYLREHPEVKAMVSAFTKHCLQSRPDSVREAAVAFFKDEASVRAAVAGSK